MSGKPEYWYPSMPISEIIEALDAWSLSVSPEQLVKPSSDFVLNVYMACLQQITGIVPESLKPSVNAAIATLDSANADLYNQSLAQNFLLYHITRFATAARFPDFNSRDIYFPQPERTRLILSAFINLVKFHEQYAHNINRIRRNDSALEAERDKITHELAVMKEKLSAIKAKRAEDEPKCDVLRQEQAAIAARLVANKDTHETLQRQTAKLKEQKKEVQQRRDGLNKETAVVAESIASKRSRIVQSPERIKRNIASMRATVNEKKQTLAANETKIRDLKAKIHVVINVDKDIKSCIEMIQGIEKEIKLLETSQQELAETREQLSSKNTERSVLDGRYELVRQQLANAKEKVERAHKHAAEKRVINQQTIEQLEKKYKEMAVDRRENDKLVEGLRAEANKIEEEKARHLKQSEAELAELLDEYGELRRHTEVYMEILAKQLGMDVRDTDE